MNGAILNRLICVLFFCILSSAMLATGHSPCTENYSGISSHFCQIAWISDKLEHLRNTKDPTHHILAGSIFLWVRLVPCLCNQSQSIIHKSQFETNNNVLHRFLIFFCLFNFIEWHSTNFLVLPTTQSDAKQIDQTGRTKQSYLRSHSPPKPKQRLIHVDHSIFKVSLL